MAKLQARPGGEKFKRIVAVAAYEDSATCARANEVCRDLSRDAGQQCEVVEQMWPVNLLRAPRLRDIAAQETDAADLIIISVHDCQTLPPELTSWIEHWHPRKGSLHKVLLALFDRSYQKQSHAAQSYLAEVARRADMEFVVEAQGGEEQSFHA
jgi:hypothetical protein